MAGDGPHWPVEHRDDSRPPSAVAGAATGRRRNRPLRGPLPTVGSTTSTQSSPDGEPDAASAGQSRGSLDELISLRWNDASSLTAAFAAHGREIAGVVMEPMRSIAGVIAPRAGYLELRSRAL